VSCPFCSHKGTFSQHRQHVNSSHRLSADPKIQEYARGVMNHTEKVSKWVIDQLKVKTFFDQCQSEETANKFSRSVFCCRRAFFLF